MLQPDAFAYYRTCSCQDYLRIFGVIRAFQSYKVQSLLSGGLPVPFLNLTFALAHGHLLSSPRIMHSIW